MGDHFIIQRFVPDYRINLLRAILDACAAHGMNTKVYSSYFSNNVCGIATKIRFSFKILLRLRGIKEVLVLPFELPLILVRKKPKYIISEDISGLPALIIIWFYKILYPNTRFYIWGLGEIQGKKRSILKKLLLPLITLIYNKCDGFICYSSYAAKVYSKYKTKNCFIVGNATNLKLSEFQVAKRYNNCKRFQYGNNIKLIFIGRLLEQKKVVRILEFLQSFKHGITFEFHIVGDGEEMTKLKEKSKVISKHKVIFHGQINDPDQIEYILENCHFGLLPGLGGLAICDYMRNGVIPIVGKCDGTEYDLINHGENGFRFENIDKIVLRDLFSTLTPWPSKMLCQMSKRAIIKYQDYANVEIVADKFVKALKNND